MVSISALVHHQIIFLQTMRDIYAVYKTGVTNITEKLMLSHYTSTTFVVKSNWMNFIIEPLGRN